MVFLKVDYEHNNATGVRKKYMYIYVRGRAGDTFLMGATLVIKQFINHTMWNMELFQKDF